MPALTKFSLQVSPDWGGQCLGPFVGNITIGSDPARCQIVLQENVHLEPEHLVIRSIPGSMDFLLSPASHRASVYIWRNEQPWPFTEPCRVQHGEYFSLVSPQGPSIQLLVHPKRRQGQGSARNAEAGSSWKLALFLSLVGLAYGMCRS